jgi:putative transcriptional regulator
LFRAHHGIAMRLLGLTLLCAGLCLAPAAAAGPPLDSAILVAQPRFLHPLYMHTVLVVKSLGDHRHVGFIVNRPTAYTLGSMFPGHEPSKKVAGTVFVGGPVDVMALFALVASEESPGKGSIEMMPGLHAVLDGSAVDQVIEKNPDAARFFIGLVVWRPGELAAEVAHGAWFLLESDVSLAFRDPEGLWEELVLRSRKPAPRFIAW